MPVEDYRYGDGINKRIRDIRNSFDVLMKTAENINIIDSYGRKVETAKKQLGKLKRDLERLINENGVVETDRDKSFIDGEIIEQCITSDGAYLPFSFIPYTYYKRFLNGGGALLATTQPNTTTEIAYHNIKVSFLAPIYVNNVIMVFPFQLQTTPGQMSCNLLILCGSQPYLIINSDDRLNDRLAFANRIIDMLHAMNEDRATITNSENRNLRAIKWHVDKKCNDDYHVLFIAMAYRLYQDAANIITNMPQIIRSIREDVDGQYERIKNNYIELYAHCISHLVQTVHDNWNVDDYTQFVKDLRPWNIFLNRVEEMIIIESRLGCHCCKSKENLHREDCKMGRVFCGSDCQRKFYELSL